MSTAKELQVWSLELSIEVLSDLQIFVNLNMINNDFGEDKQSRNANLQ